MIGLGSDNNSYEHFTLIHAAENILLKHEKETPVHLHAGIINTGDLVVNGCEASHVPVRSFLPAGWDDPVLLFPVQAQIRSCSSCSH